MRFVKGRTMTESVRIYHDKRRRGEAESLELLSLLNAFVVVCNTIAYAHSRGIIHRDLKGQNGLLGDFGVVVLLDWGLAKLLDRVDTELPKSSAPAVEYQRARAELSIDGLALGTPGYMAPEQAAGNLDQIDHLTDVYGLGTLLYEILTGQAPFPAQDVPSLLEQVLNQEPLRPGALWPQVPEDLESVCIRAMAKERAQRYPSALEVAEGVQRWQELERSRAEKALRESEAFYHSLVESLPQSILRKDLNGRFTYANQGACRILGKTLVEIIGKTDFDICPPDLAAKYRADDKLVLDTGTALQTVEEHQTVHGTKKYVRIIKAPVYDSTGRAVGIQVIFWDVTDQKELEEELLRIKAELERARRPRQ
jgi:PAS domain S-box-containing protein